jgi:monolysocardiolipin acyltransferase
MADERTPPDAESLTYTTTGTDSFPAPAGYKANHNCWVHVFPEGCVHQNPTQCLRYFKWGVSRLILESDPTPKLIPMFIDGTEKIMPEHRKWPRWAPRIGAKVRVVFGKPVDVDVAFGEARTRWKELVHRHKVEPDDKQDNHIAALQHGPEAIELRIQVAKQIRAEVDSLRMSMGYPPEDSSYALAETWAQKHEDRRPEGSTVGKE